MPYRRYRGAMYANRRIGRAAAIARYRTRAQRMGRISRVYWAIRYRGLPYRRY